MKPLCTSITLPITLLLAALILTSCQSEEPAFEPASSDTYFPIEMGGKELQLQLALAPNEQQRGLMYRKKLAKGHGMLFLFEKPERRGFWMRNTSIPLDIGYFNAEGRLLEVRKLFPYNELTVSSASNRVLIAVETNRGWYEANGVGKGARIDIKALKSAIERRGQTNSALED